MAFAMAKSMGARKTIARVENFGYLQSSNTPLLNRMGVDHVVFPDYLAAQAVIGALEHDWCQGWSEFDNGSIILVAVNVCESSPIAGHYLKDLYSESRMLHVSALRRGGLTIIPRGDDNVCAGDTLFITVVPDGLKKVMEITGQSANDVKQVILMGGSMVSELAVQLSGDRFSYVIIEKSRERCRELMESCRDCEILCGDASEYDVLEEAGINKCDAFVALTDNTESNILSCLTAIDLGVRRTVAEVEKEQLIDKAESFHLGSIINKPIITANAIFRIILDSDTESSKCFALTDAEVGRLTVKEGSFLTKDQVKDLRLPREVTFAGMIRNGKGEMVTGTTKLCSGDTVIVFCLPGALKKVEKIFGR